jgi:hypothetical protein
MRQACIALALILFFSSIVRADIPATPVMTLYRFNGPLDIPYYDIETFRRTGPSTPAGSLAQGSSVVPCLVVDANGPLTDREGIPYVGFEVVVNARTATPASTAHFKNVSRKRQSMTVADHHCDAGIRYVMDVRTMYPMDKAPLFDPPRSAQPGTAAIPPQGELDRIVRAFHSSTACAGVNQRLINRRTALEAAWERFIREQQGRWPAEALQRAKHLDYTLRTAIFEGHLERGCNAYGACERNIIALSIRNRGRELCTKRHGCAAPGDFQGVSSMVSQYNIWDEYLTQVSGLTSCYLRDDLAAGSSDSARNYRKLQSMYAQNLPDVQRILFGDDRDLAAVFPNNALTDLKELRHYYHAPAMGKCFPRHNRVEYMSGAVARNGSHYALIAGTRIQVDQAAAGGYFFHSFMVQETPAKDLVRIVDNYPGFVVDGRRVSLKESSSRCVPYGIPGGCRFDEIGRYRKTPSWVNSGKPLELQCRIAERGEQCQGEEKRTSVRVGGVCDTQMRPFAGVD